MPLTEIPKRNTYELWKGPDTVFCDPVVYATIDAFETRKDLHTLTNIIVRVNRLRIEELKWEAVSHALYDNKLAALERYISYFNRCWSLGTFLKLAHQAKPESAKIRDMFNAYNRWHLSLKELFGFKSNILFKKK